MVQVKGTGFRVQVQGAGYRYSVHGTSTGRRYRAQIQGTIQITGARYRYKVQVQGISTG